MEIITTFRNNKNDKPTMFVRAIDDQKELKFSISGRKVKDIIDIVNERAIEEVSARLANGNVRFSPLIEKQDFKAPQFGLQQPIQFIDQPVIKEVIVEKPIEVVKEVIVEKPVEVIKEVVVRPSLPHRLFESAVVLIGALIAAFISYYIVN